ncbi:MAG TPA: hypothetical protein PLU37_08910 [Chitinophagaceae bacterium]|nr:hypothetical protein [Chitinophagaceae bacterium]MCB9056435.1 hypothetical protein [Chitinophagales bacterium]HPG11635.1 hypothetical protein [Chitinophagaceae bacterium]HRX93444.1 hypothetical protein [Chitinophagaceae bacterium]
MKSNVMPGTVQLQEELTKELSQEVKETLANDAGVYLKKNFTAAEMWQHHRNRRTAATMMRKWNLN